MGNSLHTEKSTSAVKKRTESHSRYIERMTARRNFSNFNVKKQSFNEDSELFSMWSLPITQDHTKRTYARNPSYENLVSISSHKICNSRSTSISEIKKGNAQEPKIVNSYISEMAQGEVETLKKGKYSLSSNKLTESKKIIISAVSNQYRTVMKKAVYKIVHSFAENLINSTTDTANSLIKAAVILHVKNGIPRRSGVVKYIRQGIRCAIPMNFDDQDEELLSLTFSKRNNSRFVIDDTVSGYQLSIKDLLTVIQDPNDVKRQKNGFWVNDMCVNYYCDLVIRQACKNFEFQECQPIVLLTSFFYRKLQCGDKEGARRFINRRCSRGSYRYSSVFSAQLVPIVVNLNDTHWILVVIKNFKEGGGTITLYDSMGGRNEKVVSEIAAFLDDVLYENVVKSELQDSNNFTDSLGHITVGYIFSKARSLIFRDSSSFASIKEKEKNILEKTTFSFFANYKFLFPGNSVLQQYNYVATEEKSQYNYFDCGIYVMQFCYYVCFLREHCLASVNSDLVLNYEFIPAFKPADVPFIRKLIVLEMLSQKLLLRL